MARGAGRPGAPAGVRVRLLGRQAVDARRARVSVACRQSAWRAAASAIPPPLPASRSRSGSGARRSTRFSWPRSRGPPSRRAAHRHQSRPVGARGAWQSGSLRLVATRVAGPRAGLVGAWIAALYPPLVWTPAYVFSETLYMALALAHVLVAGRVLGEWGESGGSAWLLCCGVVGGLAALTRPAHLFFLLLLGLWLLARRRLRDAVLDRGRRAAGDRAMDGAQRPRVRTPGADCLGRRHHVLDRQPSARRPGRATWRPIRRSSATTSGCVRRTRG